MNAPSDTRFPEDAPEQCRRGAKTGTPLHRRRRRASHWSFYSKSVCLHRREAACSLGQMRNTTARSGISAFSGTDGLSLRFRSQGARGKPHVGGQRALGTSRAAAGPGELAARV